MRAIKGGREGWRFVDDHSYCCGSPVRHGSGPLAEPVSLLAQDARGTIVGRVADSTDAVVTGAEVRVTNTSTGVSAVSKSNDTGNFVLAYLLPGVYTVEAEFKGFKKFVRQGVQVRIGDQVRGRYRAGGRQPDGDGAGDGGDAAARYRRRLPRPGGERAPDFGTAFVRRRAVQPGADGAGHDQHNESPPALCGYARRAGRLRGGRHRMEEQRLHHRRSAQQLDKGIVFVPPQMSVSEFKVQSLSYDASHRPYRRRAGQRQPQERHQRACTARRTGFFATRSSTPQRFSRTAPGRRWRPSRTTASA